MSIEITTAFVEQYKSNVLHLAQQRGSRLRNSVMEQTVVGKTDFFERVGATAMQPKLTRHDDTPIVNTPHSRRRVALADFVWADLIDKLDKVRLLIEPESEYVKSGAWAAGRQVDDIIIPAINGNAFAGETGATLVPLPAAQKIVVGGTGMTIDKLRETKEILDAGEVDPEEDRFIVMQAKQFTDLLETTEVTSSDFNTVKALVQGDINTFLGFNFIRSQRLAVDGSADRLVLAYTRQAIGLSVGQEIITRITERNDKNHSTQVFMCMAFGATRVEEKRVVEIACSEA